jgi:uncharacterized membrane protein (UPF0127 family)
VARSFLSGARADAGPVALVIERNGEVVASAVELAGTSETRRRGLLGRDSLDPSAAIIIAPTSAIHTFFMRFVIDVAFVNREGRVLKIAHDLKPWRMAASLRGFAVVEMSAGCMRRSGVVVGDRFVLRTQP